MGIASNLNAIKQILPEGITLVAVSKTKPDEMIMEAYEAGQRDFGENKVQDLVSKKERLPADIRWHMIGHLQSNKVKYLASFVHMIHAVDSMKLLRVIQKEAEKNNRNISCLLQLRIAREDTKYGLTREEIIQLTSGKEFRTLNRVVFCGLMGMATYTDNEDQIREEFRMLTDVFYKLKNGVFRKDDSFKERSFGMSGDYRIALSEGSTMLRIGSSIFGPRNH